MSEVQRYGKTRLGKQRFRCHHCLKTFIYKQTATKKLNEQHWFKLWVKEGYSIRQLSDLSGHSQSKLKRIKNYWFERSPTEPNVAYNQYKYLIYDGTYFHKNGCLISLMNAQDQKIISHIYDHKEGYKSAYPWFLGLRENGLNPRYITMDGERNVMKAVREIWPQAIIQRCLYHIQHEGSRWLRTYPKTQAGKELRFLLNTLCSIEFVKEQNAFIQNFQSWLKKYTDFVELLPKNIVAFKDLKKTIALINNALPDMFHYLNDSKVHKTTNALESFYSRLKSDYRRHRGLTQEHKIKYLTWYCHLKNGLNTNTF